MKNKYLLLILGLGLLLRVILIDKFPPSLNWDEVSHGYNAYSILNTGKDEWGQLLPLFNFRAYGDYPLPLNLYLTIPFVAIFGLSEFSIRLPHALLGVGTLIAIYWVTKGITNNKNLALLSTFLASITPWYLFTSRFVLQSNLSVFLLSTFLALFVNRDKNKFNLPLSFLALGLTLYSYHSTRIFSPLLLLVVVFLYRYEFSIKLKERNKSIFVSMFFLVIFFIPLPFILLNPNSRARANSVFLINEGAVNKIIESRNTSKLPPAINRLIYNRPIYFAKEFTKNYIGYFSPQFLFLKGGTQYQFSIPNAGLLYLVNLPFFYIGFFVLLKSVFKREKDSQLLLVWLLLSPIPASITTEKFAVLRSTTILPLPEILSVLGVFCVFEFLRKKTRLNIFIVSFLYFAAIFFFLEAYLMKYFFSYPVKYSWAWQYGYKHAVQYVTENYSKYDKIIFTKKYGEPHEYVLFYSAWNPSKYINDPYLIRFGKSNWFWVDGFDKYVFVNDWDIPRRNNNFPLESGLSVQCSVSSVRCLLITSPGNFPDGWKKIETINFLDNKPAFEIYEN